MSFRLPGINSARGHGEQPHYGGGGGNGNSFLAQIGDMGLGQTQSTLGGPEWRYTKNRAHDGMTTMDLSGSYNTSTLAEKSAALKLAKKACRAAREALHKEVDGSGTDLHALIEMLSTAIMHATEALKGSRETKYRAIRSRLYT